MRFVMLSVLVLLATLPGASAFDDESEAKVPLEDVPKPVMQSVKAKFPQAEIKAAEREKVDG